MVEDLRCMTEVKLSMETPEFLAGNLVRIKGPLAAAADQVLPPHLPLPSSARAWMPSN
jgi:hypothetical protein